MTSSCTVRPPQETRPIQPPFLAPPPQVTFHLTRSLTNPDLLHQTSKQLQPAAAQIQQGIQGSAPASADITWCSAHCVHVLMCADTPPISGDLTTQPPSINRRYHTRQHQAICRTNKHPCTCIQNDQPSNKHWHCRMKVGIYYTCYSTRRHFHTANVHHMHKAEAWQAMELCYCAAQHLQTLPKAEPTTTQQI
jgi:hypothetical protein